MSWNSATLEVPGAHRPTSLAITRRSAESEYRSLPSSSIDSDLASELDFADDFKGAAASTYTSAHSSAEDRHYDLLESKKLRQRWFRTRGIRLCLLGTVTASSLTALLLLLPAAHRPWPHRTAAANWTECSGNPFAEPGGTLHPTGDTESLRVQSASVPAHRPLRMLDSQRLLSQACADMWVAQGEVCETIKQGITPLPESTIDAAWTYVEPTEHWQAWMEHYATDGHADDENKGTRAKNFRSHNQIQYSIRSVLQNLPFIRRGTLLSASLPATAPGETEKENTHSCRTMQVPTWFNTKAANQPDSSLQLLSHYELWRTSLPAAEAETWRKAALPTFNSRSIESQLSNLPSPAEVILYSNDDFYVRRELAQSDIATALYGTVYRLSADQWLVGALGTGADQYSGETRERNAHLTIGLVDDRFGARERNWLKHVSYTLSSAMMDEVTSIWGDELRQTAETRFRGRGLEASMPLLSTLYHIEKHREALLWSYLVARADRDGNGRYSYEERLDMRADLRSTRREDKLFIRMPTRPCTSEASRHAAHLQDAGIAPPKDTVYKWTSTQGYPYIGNMHTLYPKLDGRKAEFCSMVLDRCFGSHDFFSAPEEDVLDSQQLFKTMAFLHPSCGDCLIGALLTSTGEKGLESFLPARKVARSRSQQGTGRTSVPFIGGYTKDWQEADFSLATALQGGWTRRDFAVRLMQRYAYVLGESSFIFDRLTESPAHAREVTSRIEQSKPAFVALNDKLDDASSAQLSSVQSILKSWHERAFPHKMAFEL